MRRRSLIAQRFAPSSAPSAEVAGERGDAPETIVARHRLRPFGVLTPALDLALAPSLEAGRDMNERDSGWSREHMTPAQRPLRGDDGESACKRENATRDSRSRDDAPKRLLSRYFIARRFLRLPTVSR